MLPDRVSNPGPPTCESGAGESGALPIALRGPATHMSNKSVVFYLECNLLAYKSVYLDTNK